MLNKGYTKPYPAEAGRQMERRGIWRIGWFANRSSWEAASKGQEAGSAAGPSRLTNGNRGPLSVVRCSWFVGTTTATATATATT